VHQLFEESESDSRFLTELTSLSRLAAVPELRMSRASPDRLLFSGTVNPTSSAAKGSGVPALVKAS
jgi:hypothetical protein